MLSQPLPAAQTQRDEPTTMLPRSQGWDHDEAQLQAPIASPASIKDLLIVDNATRISADASVRNDTGAINALSMDESRGQAEHVSSDGKASQTWVDTATLWSSVQLVGKESQKAAAKNKAPSALLQALQRMRTQLIVAGRVIVKDPITAIVPFLVLCFLLAFGLWGVFSVATATTENRKQVARNAAEEMSQALEGHIMATVAPASTVKTLIELNPQWTEINKTFFKVAPGLITLNSEFDAVLTIVLCPNGIVQSIIPPNLPGWDQVYGLDLLRNQSWRKDALKTVELSDQGMVMTGPSKLRAGPMGIVCRYAVFIDEATPDTTWNAPGEAYQCDSCYRNATATQPSRKFWGFAQLNVDWERLVRESARLYDMCDRGFNMNMTYIDPVTGINRSIAQCGDIGNDPVSVDIRVMHNHWVLSVSDAQGWNPSWLPYVVAAVVVGSMWVAIAMAIIMINRCEHMWLLEAMLPKKVIATLRRGQDYAESFENVTVLFSDVVSYTTIASTMEPIQIVRLLNEMYSTYDSLVDQYECYKVETVGDAFMAVAGTQGEDPVEAAVKAAKLALAMVECTRSLVFADGQRIQIRVGMHSGPVVGAVLGFKMPHFCLCGDTVNTASRMETNSMPMRIHVSSATANLLQQAITRGERFMLERRGPVTVKGKGIMQTYWLQPKHASLDGAMSTAPGQELVAGGASRQPSATAMPCVELDLAPQHLPTSQHLITSQHHPTSQHQRLSMSGGRTVYPESGSADANRPSPLNLGMGIPEQELVWDSTSPSCGIGRRKGSNTVDLRVFQHSGNVVRNLSNRYTGQ